MVRCCTLMDGAARKAIAKATLIGASKRIIAPKKASPLRVAMMTGKDVFIPFGVLTNYFTEQNQVLVSALFRRVATFIGDDRKPLNSLLACGGRTKICASRPTKPETRYPASP
jgi:hypothetical protein